MLRDGDDAVDLGQLHYSLPPDWRRAAGLDSLDPMLPSGHTRISGAQNHGKSCDDVIPSRTSSFFSRETKFQVRKLDWGP